jgi:hypothetical protein
MQVMGEHRTFTTKWLRDHYHKLGSYLHVPNRNAPGRSQRQVDPQELRSYLQSVIEECERVVESSLTLTLVPGGIIEYNCQRCGRKTVANKEGAKRRGRVSCLHEGCEAEHHVFVAEDGSLRYQLRGWVFPCESCKHWILVPSRNLIPDYEFACDKCGRRHRLEQVWHYNAVVESGGET